MVNGEWANTIKAPYSFGGDLMVLKTSMGLALKDRLWSSWKDSSANFTLINAGGASSGVYTYEVFYNAGESPQQTEECKKIAEDMGM